MVNLLSFPLLILSILSITLINSECVKRFDKDHRLEFNLSRMALTRWSVEKYHINRGFDDHLYFWNICEKPADYPRQACAELKDNTIVGAYQWSPGHHLNDSKGSCFSLSDEDGKEQWSYDPKDPAAGLSVKWTGGHTGCIWKERSFTINFKCGAINDFWSYVSENECDYELTNWSIKNCPKNCEIDSLGNICNSRGVCGYDYELRSPKCFCYAGFTGKDCKTQVSVNKTELAPDSMDGFDPNDPFSTRFVRTITLFQDTPSWWDQLTSHTVNIDFDINGFVDKDKPSPVEIDHWYYDLKFGLLQNVSKSELEPACRHIQPSEHNDTYNATKPINQSELPDLDGLAFYYYKYTNKCISLGSKVSKWQLLDEATPNVHGFTFNYTDGSFCRQENDGTVINYSMEIDFVCPNSENAESWDKDHHLLDSTNNRFVNRCHFTTIIEHPLACPHQCRTNINGFKVSVCNGKGRCMMDPFMGYAVCNCDYGYEGIHCENKMRDATTTPWPTPYPTDRPTNKPTTKQPTNQPFTKKPSYRPTTSFTERPTKRPSNKPTTKQPTTKRPTPHPTEIPPTPHPTEIPPTPYPTGAKPTAYPTQEQGNAAANQISETGNDFKIAFYILLGLLVLLIIVLFVLYKRRQRKTNEHDLDSINMSSNDEFKNKPPTQEMIVVAHNPNESDDDLNILPTATEVKDNGEKQDIENK